MRMFWRQMRRFMQDSPLETVRENGAKKKAKLAFDFLEDRCTPANLVFSSAGLVDGSGNALANPQTGERVAVNVNWITTGLTAADQYLVRATVGGIVLDSQVFTGAADGGYSTVLTGWYAGIGITNYQIDIDPFDTVVETSNADNASGIQTFNAAAPVTLPSKFIFPVNVTTTTFSDWAITSYVDRNPNTGAVLDYSAGTLALDGSTGMDVTIPTFAAQDRGNNRVLAAASGVIELISDGAGDREDSGSINTANSIRIDHGNGWKTEYFNVALNSITVKVGDVVSGGQVIALVGSSGNSREPHLHFAVTHNGVPVEPNLDPANYFLGSLAYQGISAKRTLDQGIANYLPNVDLLEKPVDTATFPFAMGWDAYYYGRINYLSDGDIVRVTWISPTNMNVLTTALAPAVGVQRNVTVVSNLPFATYNAIPGNWRARVTVNNVPAATVNASFVATAGGGAPNFRMTAAGEFVRRDRASAIEFGTTTQGGAGNNQTFVITNIGAAALQISNIVLPTGFGLGGAAPTNPTTLSPGQTLTFVVRLNTNVSGEKVGALRFDTNLNGTNSVYLRGVVTGSPPTGAPLLFFPGSASVTFPSTNPLLIETGALVADSDSANFNSGKLVVEFLNVVSADNILAVRNQGIGLGQIGVNGASITYNAGVGAVSIGTQASIAGTSLTVTFNATATAAAIQALIRNITFANVNAVPATGIRYVRFSVTDETNKISNSTVKGILPAAAVAFSTLVSVTESGGNTAVTEGGASDSYNIVLTTNPTADVVVNIFALSQVSTQIITLTFTPADWNVPQSVTVSALDDALAEGQHVGAITHGVVSGDSRFQGLPIPNVSPVITDNDQGVVVNQSGGSTNISESGATDSVTISLGTPPSAPVTVTLAPSSNISLSGTTLTFDASNWNIPRTITISAVDDGLIQGPHSGAVGITTASGDANYNALIVPSINVAIADNDFASVVFFAVTGALVTTEGGGTAAYTVNLTSQPVGDVVVNIVPDAFVATVPTTLTFTAANWNVPQTVAVNAVNDFIVQGPHNGLIAHTLTTTDPDYAALGTLTTLSVAVNDNDVAGVRVLQSGNSTEVLVGGADDTIDFVLSSQPLDDVVINVNIPDGFTSGTPAPLIITPATWNIPHTLTVHAETNVAPQALRTSVLNIVVASNDPIYQNPANPAVTPAPVNVSVINNNLPAVILTTPVSGVVVSEGGTTSDYSISLSLAPVDGALVTVQLGTSSQITTSVPSVTFDSTNWDVPQFVTVTAVHDLIAEGTHLTPIGHTVTVTGTADNRYDGLVGPSLTVTINDIDTASVNITQPGGTTDVVEAGNNDTLVFVLNSQPTSSVTVNIQPDIQLFAGPNTITFTAANWFVPQTITIAATDDTLIQGPRTAPLAFSVVSVDSFYNAQPIPNISVNITDNDSLGVLINQTNSSTVVTELGPSDTYTVVLTTPPFADVTINVNPGNFIALSTPSLTFTIENWNIPQTVSVTAIDDIIANGTRNTFIQSAASSSDSRYNGVPIGNVAVTVNDNDIATVLLDDAGAPTTLAEGGPSKQLLVKLASQPSGNVIVTINPGVYMTVDQTSLTFSPANWNFAQGINVTAIDNFVAEGTHTGILAVETASTDPRYDQIVVSPKLIPIADNDTAGITFTPSDNPFSVTEGVGFASYVVHLTSQPTASVTVVPPANPRISYQPASLVFTPQNWNVAQTFQVTATNDFVAQGNQTFSLQHTLTTADPTYAALAVPAISLNVVDNDFVGIVIFPPNGVNLAEGGANIPYTINLNSKPSANVTVTLVPDISVTTNISTLVFTPDNWNVPQTVEAVPIDNSVPQGLHTGLVGHVGASADPGYNNLVGPNLIATIVDNDYGVVLRETGGSTKVAEGEPGDTYTVSLSLAPTANVTVTLTPDSPLVLSSTVLTFTTTNWDLPQTITVTSPNRFKTFPPTIRNIAHTDASADPNYQGFTRTLAVTLTESLPEIIGRDQNGVWTINHNLGTSFAQVQPISWNEKAGWVDVRAADVNGDGRQDMIGRVKSTGEVWVSASQPGGGYVNQRWAIWSTTVTWVDVTIGDFTGDGKQDIIARAKEIGEWWVAVSNGTSFENQKYATWSTKVTWVDVRGGDFNGDGKNEITGRALEFGEWWTGINTPNANPATGNHFETAKWETWSRAVTWADVRVGDFNGDGKDDIVGRASQLGEVWASLSGGTNFTSQKWANWSPKAAWSYVNSADFNGDGKIDILGREGANLWVSLSTGTSFTTSLWASGIPGDFTDQFTTNDFTGDGYSDYVGRVKSTGQWYVFAANAGATAFASPVLWTTWLRTSTYKDVLNSFTL